jgi:uncharacterized protein
MKVPVSDIDAPAESPASALTPVVGRERILTLDVLRGIALLGVVVANVWLWFSGIAFRFPAYEKELDRFSLDSAVFVAIAVLVSGKAVSTFSFLFGHGFAIQLLRAQARGRSVVSTYARRLTVLLFIGLAHMLLLWYGDILTAYAVLGFVLLLFRNRRDRTLLTWAAILLIGMPLLLGGLPWLLTAFGVEVPLPSLEDIARRNAATLTVFQGGSYPAIVAENVHQAGKFYAGRKAPWMLYMLGLFLIGLYAGRRRMFEDVAAHGVLFRRLIVWGIPIGLAGSIASAVLHSTLDPAAMLASPPLILLATALFVVGTVPLAAGYVSAVTLLLETPRWTHRLGVFAPVGRMAFTNYLCQTVVMLLIFYPYGGGRIGRTGPAVNLAIAVAVFAVQIVVSRVWLTHFQFGPLEWIWRSLTYGARQPMRVPTVAAKEATAAR